MENLIEFIVYKALPLGWICGIIFYIVWKIAWRMGKVTFK